MHELRLNHILAPVDLGERARAALQYAALLASRFDSRMTLLYVDDSLTLQSYDLMYGGYHDLPPATVHDMEEEVRRFASPILGDREFEVLVFGDDPAHAIATTARECSVDAVVMGTHARHGIERLKSGSVAELVLHAADRPVFTVPAAHDGDPVRTIVCPVNFTEQAREAAAAACSLSRAFGAELHLVHVAEHGALAGDREYRQRLLGWLGGSEASCRFHDVIVRGGSAADRIVDCVEDLDADLLVLGSRPKFHQRRSVIGATAESLVRVMPCAILNVISPAVRELEPAAV